MGQGQSVESTGDAALIRQANDLPEVVNAEVSNAKQTIPDGLMEAVAAEVYENVHSQLTNIQSASLKSSEKLAADLQKRLSSLDRSATSSVQVCGGERSVLLQCLKDHKMHTLSCAEAVDNYSNCALDAGSQK